MILILPSQTPKLIGSQSVDTARIHGKTAVALPLWKQPVHPTCHPRLDRRKMVRRDYAPPQLV